MNGVGRNEGKAKKKGKAKECKTWRLRQKFFTVGIERVGRCTEQKAGGDLNWDKKRTVHMYLSHLPTSPNEICILRERDREGGF